MAIRRRGSELTPFGLLGQSAPPASLSIEERENAFMQGSLHEHEVLRTMIEADGPFAREPLRAAIAMRFGVDARFHTCSSESMTAGELVESLEVRSKFRAVEGGWRVDQDGVREDGG